MLPGYKEVKTPQIMDKTFWEKSGHWDNYKDNMFVTSSEKREYAVKPMNCPGHVQIFNNGLRSYRDLPMRLAEFGSCHRNEPSGALHGLMRVRGFVQDDAHISVLKIKSLAKRAHSMNCWFVFTSNSVSMMYPSSFHCVLRSAPVQTTCGIRQNKVYAKH